jgi:hypothetical protein
VSSSLLFGNRDFGRAGFSVPFAARSAPAADSATPRAATGRDAAWPRGEEGANAQVDNHHVDDDVDIAAALSRSYLFEDLTLDDLRPLAAVASIRRLKPGEPLCRIGDPADELYVVVRGELKDTVVNIDGDEIVHPIHGQGQTLRLVEELLSASRS